MPPILEVPVSQALRRHMRRLASASAPSTPAERLDVMRRLMAAIDGSARAGFAPEESQLVSLAAHALTWANNGYSNE